MISQAVIRNNPERSMSLVMSAAYTKWLHDPKTIKLDVVYDLLTENATPEVALAIADAILPDLADRYSRVFSEGVSYSYSSMPWDSTAPSFLWDYKLYSVCHILAFIVPLLIHLTHKNVSSQYIKEYVDRFRYPAYRFAETDYYYDMLNEISSAISSPKNEADKINKNNAIKKLLAKKTAARGFVEFYDFFSKEYNARVNAPNANYVINLFCEFPDVLANLYGLMSENLFPFLKLLVTRSPCKIEQFFNPYHLIKDQFFPLVRAQLSKVELEKQEDLLLLISLYFRLFDSLPRFKYITGLPEIYPPVLDYDVEDNNWLKRLETESNKKFAGHLNDALIHKYKAILKNPTLLTIFNENKHNCDTKLIPHWEKYASADRENAKIACLAGAISGMFYKKKKLPIDVGYEIAKNLNSKTQGSLSLVNRAANKSSNHAFKQSCESAINMLARRSFK